MSAHRAWIDHEDETASDAGDAARLPAHPTIFALAGATAVGMAAGLTPPGVSFWVWLAIAAIAIAATSAVAIRVRHVGLISCLLLLSVALLGGSWASFRYGRIAPDDLAALIGDRPELIRVRGTAATTPVLSDASSGSMAVFAFQPPSMYFRLSVDSTIANDGRERPVHGVVLVRCSETIPPIEIGTRIECMGTIRRFPPASNPGEFDRAEYARVLGQAGMLTVPDRDLVVVVDDSSGVLATWWREIGRFRDALRRRASGWLLSTLPQEHRGGRDAMLSALLLGEREPDLIHVTEQFRRVGLSHLLAVSGLHLGIFVGLVLILIRITGDPRPLHAWLLIGAVLLYLFLIETRLPVLRAGLMFIFANLGAALGWRVRVRGLIALSAILLLIWRPQQVLDAGFQLSYGVVLGLIVFTDPVRSRWFGWRDLQAPSTAVMLVEVGKDMFVASIVAWLIATPMVAHHFGLVAPLAPFVGLVALPFVAVILTLGYVKILAGAILPTAAVFLGGPLSACADMLIALVDGADAVPGSTLRVPNPSWLWTVAALVVVVAWLRSPRFARRRGLWSATALVAIWLFIPVVQWPTGYAARIDMLSVGDGSCYIVRSEGATVVFDAGSSTNLDAGRQTIVPALERLGVRSIDAIAVSHANLDHMSAVLELVDRFNVREVFVTPQFQRIANDNPLGPAAFLLDELANRIIAVQEVSAGDIRTYGSSRWEWLHPGAEREYRVVNDSSMVIRVEIGDRSILLTGDIQREAMAQLLDGDEEYLRADILELPHHGSYHAIAPEFVRSVDPMVIMQSTGWSRYMRDRWANDLSDIDERLITAPHGACWVEIGEDGGIEVGRYRDL